MKNTQLLLALLAVFVGPALAARGQAGDEPAPAASGTIEMKHGYAPVNDLKLYYEIHGSASADQPPLVLLHGGGSTIETTFANILPHLAKTRQTIAFDQQGHGRTGDIAERPFTFEQSADDAAALLEHLKIEQADFFGFSNGGNIALQIAIRHPSRVRKLVVASAMVRRDGIYPEVWEFMKRSTLDAMPGVLQEAYRQTSPHPDKLQSFHDKSVKRMLEFKDWRPEDVQSIQAPTLLVIGDADSVRPEHAVEMFRLLPHAQLAVFPGGHGAYLGEASGARIENSQLRVGDPTSAPQKLSKTPELVAALIDEFLAAPLPEDKPAGSKSAALKPEDWPRQFDEHLNAGDLEAVLDLYETDARLVTRSGETLAGHDQIRPVLAGLIAAKTQLRSRVVKAVIVGEVAQLYTDFEGTSLDASGQTAPARYQAIEVLRRQSNGTWKLIVGDPNGRAANK